MDSQPKVNRATARDESPKILGISDLKVSATCVRVPVFTGHSVSINAEFDREISADAVHELLKRAPGVTITGVPNPLIAAGRDSVVVGRFRQDFTVEHGLALLLVEISSVRALLVENTIPDLQHQGAEGVLQQPFQP